MNEFFDQETVQEFYDLAVTLLVQYIPRVIFALIVLVLGFWLTKYAVKAVRKALEVREVEVSLTYFLVNLTRWGLRVLVLVIVASMVGIQMTSIVALLGAAGLAVGLALQGSLSNFAGGVLILLFKPFKVGDFIEAQGEKGTVERIDIINTMLRTFDNKMVYIPNGHLSNEKIVNYSKQPTRRVEIVMGIGYNDDLPKAREVFLTVMTEHQLVLQDPAPVVHVKELNASSVDLTCRMWCKNGNYWTVYFQVLEAFKNACDKHQIEIPYPHRVVESVTR